MSSDWYYQHGAEEKSNWYNHNPWEVDLSSSGGSTSYIYFCNAGGDQLDVYIESDSNSDPCTTSGSPAGTATWDEKSRSVYGQFANSGQFGDRWSQYSEIYMVASLAKMKNDAADKIQWHLYALTMGDDPQNVGVIGAQGGG